MKTIYSLLAVLFLFSSCYKDDNTTTNTTIEPDVEIVIESTKIISTIKDEYGRLFPDVKISIDGIESLSNEPYHYVEATNISKYNEVVTIQHPSGVVMSYPITNIENSENLQEIPIISDFKTKVIDNSTESKMVVESDLSLSFQKNVLLENGQAVEGSREIIAKRIDLKDIKRSATIPNRMLLTHLDEAKYLNISQVFFLGINGEENQDIYFDHDKLRFGEVTLLQPYYFDHNIGAWIQHSADADYRAGFYAYGQILGLVKTELQINTSVPLTGLHVDILLGGSLIKRQPLNKLNRCALLLPAGEELALSLYSGEELIETTEMVGETMMNWDVEIDPTNVINLTVDARDCDDQKIDQIFVARGKSKSVTLFPLNDNGISSIYSTNIEEEQYQVYNKDFDIFSKPITLPNNEDVRLGRQYVCHAVFNNYVVFYTEGNRRILTNIILTKEGTDAIITGIDNSTGTEFKFKFDNNAQGLIADGEANMLLNDPDLNGGYLLNCFNSDEGCGFDEIEFSYNSLDLNTYIKGKFRGKFWIESIAESNVGYRAMHGEFQVKR